MWISIYIYIIYIMHIVYNQLISIENTRENIYKNVLNILLKWLWPFKKYEIINYLKHGLHHKKYHLLLLIICLVFKIKIIGIIISKKLINQIWHKTTFRNIILGTTRGLLISVFLTQVQFIIYMPYPFYINEIWLCLTSVIHWYNINIAYLGKLIFKRSKFLKYIMTKI